MADEEQTGGMSGEELQMIGDGAEPDTHIAAEGTGPVAEDGEVSHAHAPQPMTAEEAEVVEMADPGHTGEGAQRVAAEGFSQDSPGPQDDSLADRERVAAYDANDTSDSGIDLAVVIIVLLVVLGCLIGSLVMAMNAPKEGSSKAVTKAEQEAQAKAEAEAEANRIEVAELPEGVAVVVNHVEIPESEVTEIVEQNRAAMGLEDKDQWGQWLVAMGMSVDDARESIISSMVEQELLDQAAENLGIEITDEQVDESYQETRDQFETDEEWQQALEMSGLTEETFREQCEMGLVQQAIADYAYENADDVEVVTDEQVLDTVKGYFAEYADATSLDEVGSAQADQVRRLLENNEKLKAYNAYMEKFKEESNIKMSKMPSDAPYVVFLLPYYFSGMLADAGLNVDVTEQPAE